MDISVSPPSSKLNEIVVTGDSMSMVSEACETRKPVRIYYNTKFCSNKHIRFCNSLIKKKYAFPFDTLGKKLITIKVLNTRVKVMLFLYKFMYLYMHK